MAQALPFMFPQIAEIAKIFPLQITLANFSTPSRKETFLLDFQKSKTEQTAKRALRRAEEGAPLLPQHLPK